MEEHNRLQEIARRGEEMQALYEDVVRGNAQVQKLLEQLDGMKDRLEALTTYYQGEWIRDRDLLKNHPVRDYLIFAEDPIYDEIQDWDRLLDALQTKASELLAAFRKAH